MKARTKTRLLFATTLPLGVGLLAFVLIGYGAPAVEILRTNVSVPTLLAFLTAVAASIISLSWRWGFILGTICTAPALLHLTLYRSAAHCLAVLVPSGKVGGDPLRAWLVSREQIPAGPAISSVAVDRVLEIASTSPFSIAFGVILLQHGIPQIERALLTVAVATLALVVGIAIAVLSLRRGTGLVAPLVRAMRLNRFRILERKMGVLSEADAAAADLIGNPQRMISAFAVGLAANLLVIAEFVLLLSAFGLPTEPAAVVAAIFATGAAHMLPIPAGLGVLEGANMWLFQMMGYPIDVGLAVGLAARLRELIWMLPGVAFLLAGSIRRSISEISDA